MHDKIRLLFGVAYLVWAIIAFRELVDREIPRVRWVKACLAISAVVATLTGIIVALEVNRHADAYIPPAFLRQLGSSFKGVTLGLLLALILSGQLSKKKPPEQ